MSEFLCLAVCAVCVCVVCVCERVVWYAIYVARLHCCHLGHSVCVCVCVCGFVCVRVGVVFHCLLASL